MCSSHIQGTSSSPPSSSSSSPAAAAAAAFLWLLQGSDQLAVCPDEAWAAAAFQAVCCGCPALAAAAYRRLLGWCGASEVQTGQRATWRNLPDPMWITALCWTVNVGCCCYHCRGGPRGSVQW
jgi:hypothetical protein